MDLIKALAKVLEGSGASRIHAVADILKNGGVTTADDLKYFYWTSLKDLGGLSNMEVNKIMRYVQEKFPEEYEEYKRKRNEERKLQNEVEILNFKAEHEKKLQQVKMKFDEEMEKRLKEQQEMEEQLKCTQEQSETSKGKLSSWAKKPMECWNDFKKWATISETGDDKDMTSEQAVSKIFGENSPVIEPVTCFLKSQKIAKAKDMSNLDWETLKCYEECTTFQLEKVKEFVEKNFPENNTKHKNWNCKAEVQNHQPSKCENMAFEQWEQPRTDENIEEVISEIFAEFSNEARIHKIIEILLEDDITRGHELSCFDWKLLENLGLTSSEATRIMDFVKEQFPKHYKRHEIRRDEVNRMQEELLKQAEINELLKSEAKQSREKKTEDVGMQGKQSTSRAEATELRQKIDEATSKKIEDLTQTTNSSQLQEESQKSSSNSETKNFQTWEECSNHQAGNPPNDKFKDSNSNNNNNTSNDQQQKSEEYNQSLEKQPSPCEVIETENIGNSSNNTDKRKDESLVKDVANLNYGRFTKV